MTTRKINPSPTRDPAVTGYLTINDDWKAKAACLGMALQVDPIEFVGGNTRGDNAQTDQCRLICATCPVRPQCLDYAFEQPTSARYGVYAGTSGEQRQRALHLADAQAILHGWFDRWVAASETDTLPPREYDLTRKDH